MNFKGWKKTSDNKDCAVFNHPNGCKLTIAKKMLSKKHLEELHSLPLHAAEGIDTADVATDQDAGLDQPQEQVSAAGPGGIPLVSAQNQMPEASQPGQQASESGTATPEQDFQRGHDEAFAKHANEFGKQAALWGQDLANGHVAPKTYADLFADKSTLGKAGTIFGLLLSGAGSGMTGQENAALKIMQRDLENDFDAQKQNKTNAMNYYKANLEHQRTQSQVGLNAANVKNIGANTEATAIANAKNQMGLAYLHKITGINDKLPPDKQAKGQQLINGVIAPAVDAYIQNNSAQGAKAVTESEFQQKQSDLRNAEGFGALPGGNSMAQVKEQHHYPGIPGESSVALDKGDRDYINSGINFDKQLKAFTSWTKAHSGDLNPEDIKKGTAMAAELQGAYRQATNGGVFKEGEQNFISKIIDSKPTKFFNEIRVIPQLGVIAKDNQRRLDTKVRGLGFDGFPGYKETKWVNGIEYMEGPGGKAVPVNGAR